MARLRSNNVFGTLTDNPLTNVATVMNSAGLVNLTAVAGADQAVITLDPNRVNGAPEIVYVTAHTGSATSATILRGQEGTAARQHPSGTFWTHGWTALDAGLGQIGYAQVTASQTGISTLTDLTGLSVAVTAGTNRRIRITASGLVARTVVDGTTALYVREGGTVLQIINVQPSRANEGTEAFGHVVLTPSAGSHTYKLSLERNTGTGTTSMAAGATFPASILVEDIGAA